MAFIGTPLDTRNTFQSLQGKRFNGDGSTTAFTLDVAPSSTLDIEVFVGNVRQDPNSAYTLSGTTLTFTGAPPSGTNNIYVVHQAKSVGTISVPDSYKSDSQTISGARTFNGAITMGGTTPTLTIGDAGAEDTKIVFDGNAQDYHIGLDDSADDLVIGLGSALGTTTHMAFDEAGHITKPLQPAFFVKAADQSNIAVGSFVDITFNNEIFDKNSDFNTSNYTFTAPVTGTYLFNTFVTINALDDACEVVQINFNASNRSFSTIVSDLDAKLDSDANEAYTGAFIVDMDASDTIKMRIQFSAGSAQSDINTDSAFAGVLIA
jgi:hypothetical protein